MGIVLKTALAIGILVAMIHAFRMIGEAFHSIFLKREDDGDIDQAEGNE